MIDNSNIDDSCSSIYNIYSNVNKRTLQNYLFEIGLVAIHLKVSGSRFVATGIDWQVSELQHEMYRGDRILVRACKLSLLCIGIYLRLSRLSFSLMVTIGNSKVWM